MDKQRSYSQPAAPAIRTPASSSRSSVPFQSDPRRSESSRPRRAPTRTKSVNKVELVPICQVDIDRFLDNPSDLVDFPPDCTDLEKVYGVNTIIALNSINADTTSSSFKQFDTTMKRKVCNATGHSFDDCPVVQNVPFIKTAFIKTSLFLLAMEKDQAQLNVDVAAVDSDAYHPAQDVESSNESASDGSEPEDFYQGD